MRFIWKFFRALNSAQTPFQITFALALGMLMGLTPLSGVQTGLILLLAFVLNIHLGLFFLASAFFAGVGYLVDPWLEQLGYALLVNESLHGFWSALYQTGIGRLTFFNNTIVLGSTVAALLLALPMVLVLNRLIALYRVQLQELLQRHPFFGKFGLLSVADVPMALFRWWGAGAFALFAAIVTAVMVLVADPFLKWGIEKSLSGLLQRPVSVASATVRFTDFSIEINTLEVASEEAGKNAVSIETIRFDPDMTALVFQTVHIEEALLKGIAFSTLSRNPMPAAEVTVTEAESSPKEEETGLPSLSVPSPESLLATADLSSVKLYESSQKEIDALSKKWQKVADEELSAEALKGLEKELAALQELSKSKEPQQLLALTEKVNTFTAKLEKRKKRLAALQTEFNADQKRIEKLLAEVQAAPMADFERLKGAYSLSGSGTMNIVGALFGDKIKSYLERAQLLYTKFGPYLKSDAKEAMPPPARGEGRWIEFAAKYPRLWIEDVRLEGTLNAQQFAGAFRNISDNQKVLQKPITMELKSDGEKIKGLKLYAKMDRMGEEAVDSATFAAARFALEGVDMGMLNVSQSDLAFDGKVRVQDASGLEGGVALAFSKAQLAAGESGGELAGAIGSLLKEVDGFRVDAAVEGTLESPQLSVSSDLDKKLSSAMQKAMKKELASYEKELKEQLEAKTEGQLSALTQQSGAIVDIGALAGEQSGMLSDLSANASGMLKPAGGSDIKNILPF